MFYWNPESKIDFTGDSVAVLLNNLGSTSETEMNILVMETIEQLGKMSIIQFYKLRKILILNTYITVDNNSSTCLFKLHVCTKEIIFYYKVQKSLIFWLKISLTASTCASTIEMDYYFRKEGIPSPTILQRQVRNITRNGRI